MAGKADAKTSRCWPGFEPVPGKGEHEQGSCRKKPASRNGGQEVDRERSRKKQVAAGGERGKQARSKSPDASERKSVGKPKKAATEKTAAKKAATKKPAAKKAAAKKTATKKAATKKAATKKAGAATAGKGTAARAKKSVASTRKKATAAR